jgi:hypothetical protein
MQTNTKQTIRTRTATNKSDTKIGGGKLHISPYGLHATILPLIGVEEIAAIISQASSSPILITNNGLSVV